MMDVTKLPTDDPPVMLLIISHYAHNVSEYYSASFWCWRDEDRRNFLLGMAEDNLHRLASEMGFDLVKRTEDK